MPDRPLLLAVLRLPPPASAAAALPLALLDPEEWARIATRRLAADRMRAAAAQLMMRHLVGQVVDRSWRECRVGRGERGRPVALDAPVDVSVSHAGPWIVGAAARSRRVGVDTESVEAVAAAPRAAFLCGEEMRESAPLAPRDRVLHAGVRWCLKEAEGKAAGTGLDGLRERSFLRRHRRGRACWRARGRTLVAWRGPARGYVIAACWDGRPLPLVVDALTLQEIVHD